jgi:hypothetical protein
MSSDKMAALLDAYAKAPRDDREQIREVLALIFEQLPPSNVAGTNRAALLAELERVDRGVV